MTHARQQIREAVATALTGLTTTGSKVYQSRMLPQGDAGLPCLLITTASEEIDGTVQAHQLRDLTIVVRGYARAVANLDDTLDVICAEVETALQTAGTLGGKVPGGLMLQRIETDLDDALDKPAGVVEMQFKAGYFTSAGIPGAFV